MFLESLHIKLEIKGILFSTHGTPFEHFSRKDRLIYFSIGNLSSLDPNFLDDIFSQPIGII